MSSTRLPGKVLKLIGKDTVINFMLRRLKRSKLINNIIDNYNVISQGLKRSLIQIDDKGVSRIANFLTTKKYKLNSIKSAKGFFWDPKKNFIDKK